MHPLKLSQCAPESGIMWEDRCAMLGAVMGFRVLCHTGGCWGKGLVAQPGGPSSWLKSYLSSMSNAMVHTGLCQQLLTDWWFSLQSLTGHTTPIESLQVNPNEKLIVAGSRSGSIRVWDLEAAKGMCPWVFASVHAHFFGESLCLMSVLAQKVPDLRRSRRLALLSSSCATLFLPFYWGYRAVYSCSSRNLDIYRGHWSEELLSMVLTWVCQNLYSRSVSMHV